MFTCDYVFLLPSTQEQKALLRESLLHKYRKVQVVIHVRKCSGVKMCDFVETKWNISARVRGNEKWKKMQTRKKCRRIDVPPWEKYMSGEDEVAVV